METPSLSPVPSLDKPSLGEELFLVHLNRFDQEERSPDDFDRDEVNGGSSPCQRERSLSRGEELWHVHCKRMEQSEPDYDEDVDTNAATAAASTTTTTPPKLKRGAIKNKGNRMKRAERPHKVRSRILQLRNRDVEIPKKA